MYDVASVKRRYFQVKLHNDEHETVVDVAPPKLKVLEKLLDTANTATTDSIKELQSAVKELLSSNKAHYHVPDEYIETMDFDELVGLLEAFFTWMADTKKD